MAFKYRPSDFTGFIGVASGVEFNITADDWNAFLSKVEDFAKYKKKGNSINPMSMVSTGDEVTSTGFNRVVSNLTKLNPPTSPPSSVAPLDDIYASYYIRLKNALNSIQ